MKILKFEFFLRAGIIYPNINVNNLNAIHPPLRKGDGKEAFLSFAIDAMGDLMIHPFFNLKY